jgi:tRNA (uracil-5-)-methyltransferase
VPYAEQLERKRERFLTVMAKLKAQLEPFKSELPWLAAAYVTCAQHIYALVALTRMFPTRDGEAPLCPVLPVRPSPTRFGYRNKCEFSVGPSPTGEAKCVGFRIGNYRDGNLSVGSADAVPNVPDSFKHVARVFQDYIRASPLDQFDLVSHHGVWAQLTVRNSSLDELLVCVHLTRHELSDADFDRECAAISAHFSASTLPVSTLLVQCMKPESITRADGVPRILTGPGFIRERLFDLEFRVSLSSFFQVNSRGAEVLYGIIRDWCAERSRPSPASITATAPGLEERRTEGTSDATDSAASVSTVTLAESVSTPARKVAVLDVCCGTGTIGMCVARHVDSVFGVEIVASAVEDARANAQRNGVKNVHFQCAPAEKAVPHLAQTLGRSHTVLGILDPPRAGVQDLVIKCMRECRSLTHLVYISCDADAALKNFADLCRPVTNRLRGIPFRPVQAVPVDLFPDTAHCELVVLFERCET